MVTGVPILGAIRGENLSDTVCVVVRYFGGIKLGAGGLIRAYGGAARLVLQDAPVQILLPTVSTARPILAWSMT
jgi:putative IMPACT (imprinted ancient) family translation regulator